MQRKGFLLLALVCGFLAAVSAYIYLNNTQHTPQIDLKPIVVAKSNIPARSIIKAEQLTTKEIPSQGYPSGGASSLEDVVGAVALINLAAGDTIVNSMIQAPQGRSNLHLPSSNSTSLAVPEGKRAVAVPINLVSGVGYDVKPGDYVDVLVTVDIMDSTGKPQPTTSLAAQDVQVLSIGGITVDEEGNKKTDSRSYTLALSVPQAMAVTFGSEKGTIRLLLRNPANAEVREQTPFTADHYLDPNYFNRFK